MQRVTLYRYTQNTHCTTQSHFLKIMLFNTTEHTHTKHTLGQEQTLSWQQHCTHDLLKETQVFQHTRTLWTSQIHSSKAINHLVAQTSWRISQAVSVFVHFSPRCLCCCISGLVSLLMCLSACQCEASLHEMHVTSRMYEWVCVCLHGLVFAEPWELCLGKLWRLIVIAETWVTVCKSV